MKSNKGLKIALVSLFFGIILWITILSLIFSDTNPKINSNNLTKKNELNLQKNITEKAFSFTVEQFISRYNKSCKTIESNIVASIGEENEKTGFLKIFLKTNKNVALILKADIGTRAVTSIIFMGSGDGSAQSGINIILGTVAVVMAIENPNMPIKQRGEIIKKLVVYSNNEEATIHRNGVEYYSSYSDKIGFILACSNDNQNKQKVSKKFLIQSPKTFEITYDKSKISKFSIEKESSSKMKAMDKRLSEYSNKELEKLPTKIKKTYSMVVPSYISRENLENTLKYFIFEETSKDTDIDEIVIFVYDNKNDVGRSYTFGKLVWAPYGEIGNVTSEIAAKNDRSNYKFKIDIKEKVGNMNKITIPTEKEFAIYDMLMDSKYSSLSDEALDKKVMKKFGIKNKKELNKIFYKVINYKNL